MNDGGVKVLYVVRDAKVMNAKRKARQIKVQRIENTAVLAALVPLTI